MEDDDEDDDEDDEEDEDEDEDEEVSRQFLHSPISTLVQQQETDGWLL